MSTRFLVNNTLIKEGSSFYLLADGIVYNATTIEILEPTIDDKGNKAYLFYVDVTEDNKTFETFVLSSGDPFINQKVFPTLSAIHNHLTLPFENGEKAYFIDAKGNDSVENVFKGSVVKEVSVIVTPARRNHRHITPIMQYNNCIFRIKDKNGSVSEEYIYNVPFKNLFKTREEAEKELRSLKLSSIAFYVAELAAEYASKREVPYAIDFSSFGEEVHDIINPVFKEFVKSNAYGGSYTMMAAMAEKVYCLLDKHCTTV